MKYFSVALVLSIIISLSISAGQTMAEDEVIHQGETVILEQAGSCLECHDNMENHSHPVSALYPPPGKENFFFPAYNILEAGLILVNDRIECISCHNLRNQRKFHLAIDNYQSKLCSTCHLM